MASFFIGNGDVPGNELLSASGTFFGNFIRSITTDRLLQAGTFLEWYFETSGGGGEFGEGPPHFPRVGGHAVLSGALTKGGPAADNPQLTATASVTGSLIVSAVITNAELLAAGNLFGGLQIAVSIVGEITAASFLAGDLIVALFPELSRDAIAQATGVRPCFPLLIYLDDVSHIGNLHEPDGVTPKLELNQAFRMAASYTAPPGEQLGLFGALPNSIGMRVLVDLEGDGIEEEAILFRRPEENEVVALLDGTVEKYDAESGAWVAHTTLPQRALMGMRVFEILDPNGIYDYYAKLVGLKYHQLAYDTRKILDFIDPELCPIELLPLLASNFGADIDADQPEILQREILRSWVPLMQIKGLDQAVRVALRMLGFSGYATQIWIKPGGSATDFIEKPFNYSNEFPTPSDPTVYHPAAQVAIHLNELDGTPFVVIDDSTKQKVATFLKMNVLPAHVRIRTFTTDIVVEAEDAVVASDAVVAFEAAHIALVAAAAGPATTSFVVSVLPVKATVAAQAGAATTLVAVEVISP